MQARKFFTSLTDMAQASQTIMKVLASVGSLIKQLAIPLSNQNTVAKWLVIIPPFPRKGKVRTNRFATLTLMLCVASGLPHYASADSYCPVTDDGKIWIDQCIYSSNDECKRATGTKGNCVADQTSSSSSTKAPYCLILGSLMGASEICDKYQDYESCSQDAQKQAGNCIKNINYDNAGK